MKGYMSTSEAMAALGVTRSRIAQLIKAGRLDAVKVGNAYAVTVESVERRVAEKPGPGNPNFGSRRSKRGDGLGGE